jgi:hypothetical protein
MTGPSKEKPDLSLVMPCYNEEEVVAYTIGKLQAAFARAGIVLEIVAVDNGSRDRTGEIIASLARNNPQIVPVRVEVNDGYGGGVLEGLPHCTADWAGIIPADGQVDAEDVVRLFEAARVTNGRVLAKVRRRFRMDGIRRKLVSTTYNLFFRALWPSVRTLDVNGSPKMMRREYLQALNLQSHRWFLDPELVVKAHYIGLRVLELNVFGRMRGTGLSHVQAGTCWEFFRDLIKFRLGGRKKVLAGTRFADPITTAQPAERRPEPAAADAPSGLCRKRDTCRGCGGRDVHRFLSLGATPLANRFLKSPEEFLGEMSYPLEVYFCKDCSLVQLMDVVDSEALFRDYIYVTGTSDTMAEHNRRYAEAVTGFFGLGPADLAVEIASNDGSLLRCFQSLGVRTLGVEPAANIAAGANAGGVDTINDFFDSRLAARIRGKHGPARAVVANNVLAHVDEPRDFLAGAAALLDGGGGIVVEAPYLGELVRRLEYDTIYHEHLSYFSVTALARLFAAAGLSIVRIDRVEVHGGSLRVWARRPGQTPAHAPEVEAMCRQEQAEGWTSLDCFQTLACRVQQHRERLRGLLEDLKSKGESVVGYGAPAKGNTLLNYCGIDARLLPYTVDKNPMKVGKFTPGTHIPVHPVSRLLEDQPSYVLILAWNFADEIMRQQQEYRSRGGRFIVPIPEPAIV